jgi:thioredoxin 2
MSATINTKRPVTVPCAFCSVLNRVDLERLQSGPKCAECRRPIRLDRPVKVTDASFDRVVADASVPIALDCYADWCGPCRAMAPTLDELAHAHAGRALVLKLDTDANPLISQRLGIRGIPTVVGFRGGKEVGRHVGLASLRELEMLVR